MTRLSYIARRRRDRIPLGILVIHNQCKANSISIAHICILVHLHLLKAVIIRNYLDSLKQHFNTKISSALQQTTRQTCARPLAIGIERNSQCLATTSAQNVLETENSYRHISRKPREPRAMVATKHE